MIPDLYVTDNYYHLGTLKYQIDCDALEDHLREDYDEIAWVSCSVQGTRLHIVIKETLDRKTKQNPKKPCDIVANKSGIITKMANKKKSLFLMIFSLSLHLYDSVFASMENQTDIAPNIYF